MREEFWQCLVAPALCETFTLDIDMLFAEVKTEDGSIADLVFVTRQGRIIVFELKMAELGEAACRLGPRGTRQLRHYKAAADQVYLVTVASPRGIEMTTDGRVRVVEPAEAQSLPDGVGWVMFDQLSMSSTIVTNAPSLKPKRSARCFVLDHIGNRLGRVQRALQAARASV